MNTIFFILLYIGYLVADAFQDKEEFDEGETVNHKTNWIVRAVAALPVIFGVEGWNIFWGWFTFGAFLGFLAWNFFDPFINWIRGKGFKHVGSGGLDTLFKKLFPKFTAKALFIAKLVGIGVTFFLWNPFN